MIPPNNLFGVLSVVVVLVDVEVTELVGGFVRSDNVKVITELILLQVLFGQVLQVSLGERRLSINRDLGLIERNLHTLTEVGKFAIDFDALLKISLKSGGVHDVVGMGLGVGKKF
jgi:hypothetical protein